MDPVTLPFIDWMPDLAPIDLGGINDVDGAYPKQNSYSPWRSLVNFSDALNSACIGAMAARDVDGNTSLFGATTTKLYIFSNSASTWTDATRTLSAYAVPTNEFWGLAQFGANVIAVNITDPPQKYVLGSSTQFEALGGSPPSARHIAIVRDFVVFGNLTGGANEVQWSGFNNSESWTAGVNQSDTQEFFDVGQVQAVVGGEVGFVVCEQAISRMTYVGGDVIFQFDQLEYGRGTQAPRSVIRYTAGFFYYGRDGFYYFNGQSSEPIGNEKVDRWFKDNADPAYLATIVGAYDPLRKLIMWTFASISAPAGVHDMLIFYNPNVQGGKWSKATQSLEYIAQTTSPGYTLEGLDTVSSSLDALTVSLDSPQWAGGNLSFIGFGTDHKAGTFSGATLALTLTTQEKNQYQGGFLFVSEGTPIVDSSSATITMATRSRFADSISYTSAYSMMSNGVVPVRARGRTFFGKMSIAAGTEWTHAEGITFKCRPDGLR